MKKVFVGMSGGVDSSLSAALLVEQGYDVTGVYMKNWTQDLPGMQCPWAEDLADAKRVAVQLGIAFKVYDFQTEYRHKVVDYMIDEYKAGRTPNPDIMCNQEVKFKLFLETALADGADMIATGHYARVNHGSAHAHYKNGFAPGLTRAPASGQTQAADVFSNEQEQIHSTLQKAKDVTKDQTYFLYRVTSEALSKTLFPLGEYKKTQVRKLAKERGLLTATKKDSQGICFVGSVGIQDFLSEFVETSPGEIFEKETGKLVGKHDGAIFYTLGQRHGMNVGGGLPYYVVGKDMAKNEVYVSRNLNDKTMWKQELKLEDVHWINEAPKKNEELLVRLRHRGALKKGTFDGKTVHLAEPERAVASGQSAVLYRADEVLGGGVVV